ncbi:MAG: hypothetical protein ACRBDI_10650 [Alphaproteobacteria bacterium]
MTSRLDRLYNRRIDNEIQNATQLNEVYKRLTQSDSVKYVLGAMQPIDPAYTKATYAEGERVWNQLEKSLDQNCVLRYQGSVTNDTHIKAKSDIDLLTILTDFVSLELPQTPSDPYQGDPLQDLMNLRNDEIRILDSAFPEVSVDSSGGKSICLEGGSLRRKIDVVPSNWYNTNLYAQHREEVYRGVKILDAKNKTRIGNTPFLHNAYIDLKDDRVNGGIRKAARLMKSLAYDTEEIDLSSYDIVAIAYNMDDNLLNFRDEMELAILESCSQYCERLVWDESLRANISVPDGHRTVFKDGHATKAGLIALTQELNTLKNDVMTENARSFQKLADARVYY